MKKYIIVLLLSCAILPVQLLAQSKTNKKQIANGSVDRIFWVKTLYKMSYPVVHNLAEETLKKNMPLEKGDGYGLNVTKVTYLEALGRTMAGLAPWLALPDEDTEEGKMRKSMRQELLKGLANSVNPASPDYMNYRTESQPIVDAAFVAHAFLRAPKALWEPLDEITKKRFVEEFKSLRTRSGAYNNWLLFAGITEGFLLSIGEQYDPARVQFAVNKLKEWYVGDSWYSDGAKFSMDYYNSFVIHPMLVDLLKVLADKKRGSISDYNTAVERMSRQAAYLERVISPDGTFPVFGRSMTYRTAVFQALAQTALIEKLPEGVDPEQVRCALTKVMHKMYDGNQNFDKDGWLVLGFNGHQSKVADSYTSTGSLYMATMGFLTLGLPAENKFWSGPALPWTSVKAWGGEMIMRDHKIEN